MDNTGSFALKKSILAAGLLATGSLLTTVAHADTVTFEIETLPFAYQYGLDAGGNVVSTMVDSATVGFSETFTLAGLSEWWQTGVVSSDYGTAIYTTAQTAFGPVTASGEGAFTASSLAQNTLGLPLSGYNSVTGFVNFWDNNDPALSDWGNNNLNFSITFYGSNDSYQSDVAYINDWFSYSRQYVIQLDGPISADGVYSYDLTSLFTALENGGLSSVSYYESFFSGSANCVVNVSCVNTRYDGMQYLGFGQYEYADSVAVDSPASIALLAAGPLLMLNWRKRKARR